ncbi:exported hypothetical protein [Candidatus Sulfopaludibacter sp. SbA4]|nr:exported hypothetical protein [Candidatus Sulfopaludibacter sp. SbA4]
MALRSRSTYICAFLLATALSAPGQLRPITAPAGKPAVFPSEVLTVSRYGVYPLRINRPQGPFVLYIENRLGNHEEVFTLVRDGSPTALLQLATSSSKARDHAAIDPQPGLYHLQFRNNTKFSVDIAIAN